MSASAAKFSLLIIARHAGEVGSGGSRRPVLLAKALASAGHRVRLIAPFVPSVPLPGVELDIVPLPPAYDDPDVPDASDGARLAAMPAGSLSQRLLDRLPEDWALTLRRWKYIPDFELVWAGAVRAHVLEQDLTFDWVLTTSPPESTHVHGAEIAAHVRGRWVMEWRDGWTVNSHRTHVRGLRKWIERRMAKRCLATADAVVAIDKEIAGEVEAHRRSVSRNGNAATSGPPLLTLGHFSEPFAGQPARLDPGAFHLVHAGGLSLSYRRRDVSVLLQALEPAARQRAAQGFPPLVLHILGRLSEAEEDALARADLRCVCHGPVSLDRSRALQAAADALLLWIPEESLALPGKYAEYVQSGRPVVYLGPEKWRRLAPAGSGFLAPDALRALRLDGGALRDPMTQAAHAGEVFADFLQTADQTEEDRGGSDQGAALSGWERVAHTRLSPAFTVSGQIQVEDLDALKAAGVRTLICNRPDDETQDQPRAQEIGARAAQLGMRFHHVPMSPGQMTDALVTKLGDILKRNPVAVHAYCRSGRRSQQIFERLTQDLNADRDPLG